MTDEWCKSTRYRLHASCNKGHTVEIDAIVFWRGVCPACRKQVADALRSAKRSDSAQRARFQKLLPPIKTGAIFGRWTAIADEYREGKYYVVQARCACGHLATLMSNTLHSGKSTQCKTCNGRKCGNKRKEYWGYADVCPEPALRRALLNRIAACLNRCHNPNDSGYASYGGRGVYVHEPWRSDRKAFLGYLMNLPHVQDVLQQRLELDRANTDEGYEPGNLRFVSRLDNARNKRRPNDLSQRILKLEKELEKLRATSV